MKCPLTMIALSQYSTNVLVAPRDCLQAECAWWEDTIGKCSIRRIWIALQDIHEVLHDLIRQVREGGKA